MEAGLAGALFIVGSEQVLRANKILLVVTLDGPIDRVRLAYAYARFVRDRPLMRMTWGRHGASGSTFGFEPLDERETQRRIALEQRRQLDGVTLDDVVSSFDPTGSVLPLRVAPIAEDKLVFEANHAFLTGLAAVHWQIDFMRYYAQPDAVALAPLDEPVGPSRSRLLRVGDAIAGVARTATFYADFFARAGSRASDATVDLSHGGGITCHERGYHLRTRELSVEETDQVCATARRAGATLTAWLCAKLAELLFEARPDKRRVALSVPVNLGPRMYGFSRQQPGNYTGGFVVQLFRGEDLVARSTSILRAVDHGVALWATRIFGASARDGGLLLGRVERATRLPFVDRGPFMGVSATVSNFGVLPAPLAGPAWKAAFVAGYTQTIFLGAATVAGRMSLAVLVANDLFDVEAVDRLFDALPARLLSSREAS